MNKLSLMLSLGFFTIINGFKPSPATSQVTVNQSSATTVTENNNVYTIENGDRLGDNLFHTFEQFSVTTEGEAFFDNAEDVSNIFSRVTGGQLSNIDGLIRANGAANLFLINPAGIMFGDNASLDIGGSFYGTTADSILFEEGEFSAIAPETPTLVINAPIGFTFRDNPAEIARAENSETQLKLSLRRGGSFNLIGGNISLKLTTLKLTEGSVELASISEAGTVDLNINANENLTIPENLAQGIISLDNSIIETLAIETSGDINLTARNLSLLNESRITNQAGVRPEVAGAAQLNDITTASAGNINIDIINSVIINDSSSITTDTFVMGNAGNIFLEADTIDLNRNSNISASVGNLKSNSATGNGGLIKIDTGNLSLDDGATIITQTFAPGNAGRIDVNATESVSISGVATFPIAENGNPGGFSSGLISNTEPRATGIGGEITVTTPRLQLSDGGVISVRSRSGSAAGNINVDTEVLEITDGSQILATAFAGGDAGNINLDVARQLSISGSDPDFDNRFNAVENSAGFVDTAQFTIDPVSEFSGIFANTDEASTALGGNISIGRFSIADDSFSLDNTQFTSEIVLSDRGQIAVDSAGNGDGGNISLNTERLTLDGNSTISARAVQGNGGNININTNDGFVVAFSSSGLGSDVFASASGTGGSITIAAESVLGLAEGIAFDNNGNRLNNNANDLDASGELESGTIEIDASEVNPLEKTPQLSANTIQAEQNISQICNSGDAPTKIGLIFNGKGGVPPEPTAPLTSDELLTTEQISNSDSYNPPLTLDTSIGKIIPAMGAVVNPDGTVSLVSSITPRPDRNNHTAANCRFPQSRRH